MTKITKKLTNLLSRTQINMKIISSKNSSESEIVAKAVRVLGEGGLVIFPTETTYGAGVDATNPVAVEKLLAYKSRREGKPLSIAVTGENMAKEYVQINEQARRLYQVFLPGPLTVVSLGRARVAPGVESEFGTLGVRIPDYKLVLDIAKKLGRPITATSANVSGKKRPYQIADILGNLSGKQKKLIDLIVDVGELPKNKPSTIIDTTLSTPVVLREGDGAGEVKGDTNQSNLIARLTSHSEQETKAIAGKFLLKNWEEIKGRGLIVGLDGDLGAGKTIFAKGVAEFLQIEEVITSPTYSYVNEHDYLRYGVRGKFFHFDVWKVGSEEELTRLDFFKVLGAKNVIVVEWWDQIKDFVRGEVDEVGMKVLTIKIKDLGGNKRKLEVREI